MNASQLKDFLRVNGIRLPEEGKMQFPESKLKFDATGKAYSTPTLITGYGAFYYLCDRPPVGNEPDCYQDIPDFYYQWIDQTDMQVWSCLNNSSSGMIWQNIATGTTREESPISLAFATPRQPSLTNDVEVSVDFNFTALLSTSETVNLLTSPDNSTWTTKRTITLDLGLASNKTLGFNHTITPGHWYQFTKTGSSTVTVVNHFELIK